MMFRMILVFIRVKSRMSLCAFLDLHMHLVYLQCFEDYGMHSPSYASSGTLKIQQIMS